MMRWPGANPDYRLSANRGERKGRFVRWIGDLCFHCAFVCGFVKSIFSPKRRRILVIRTDGLGDAVLCEPMLRGLKKRYGRHEIHLWAPTASCELFSSADYVKQRRAIPRGFKAGCIGYFNSPRQHWRMGWNIGRYRFEITIYPAISPEPFGNWLFVSARSDKRWIVDGDRFHQFDWQQNSALRRATRILAKPAEAHELARNANLARQCGVASVSEFPQISISPASEDLAARQIARWHATARQAGAAGILGVITSSSNANFSYPPDKWQIVLSQIWASHRLMPVFLSPDRSEVVSRLLDCREDAQPGIPWDKPQSLLCVPALAAALRSMDAVISLDTGPAHIAGAMRVPTVVLRHGGEPGRFFPWPNAPWVRTLHHPMPCQGCICRCVLDDVECLTQIEPAEVLRALNELLGRRTAQAA